MKTFVLALFCLGLSLSAAGAAGGQVLPTPPPPDWDRSQREFTAEALRDYNAVMNAWLEAWQRDDAAAAARIYTDGANLMLPEGDMLAGRAAIQQRLASTLPAIRELRTGLVDFVATTRLAYAMGPFWYEYVDASGAVRSTTGTHVTVMTMEGRRWRIRSQVFRPSTDGARPSE